MSKKKARKYFIYGLVDPRNDEIYYIGCTTNPSNRLSHHKQEAKAHEGILSERKLAILDEGYDLELKVLDTITTPSLRIARWLEYAYMSKFGWDSPWSTIQRNGNIVNRRRAAIYPIHYHIDRTIDWLKSSPEADVDQLMREIQDHIYQTEPANIGVVKD